MRLGLGPHLRLALHCSCVTCGKNVGNKGTPNDDAVEAALFGLRSVYDLCPSCLQRPLDAADEDYRRKVRVVLFERHGIVLRDGVVTRPNRCPECGGETYRTRAGIGQAGDEAPRRETDVLACTACEHIEEVK